MKLKGMCGRSKPCRHLCARSSRCPLGLIRRRALLQALRSRRLQLNKQGRLF